MREQMGTTTKKATFKTQLTQLAESGGVLKQVSEAFKTYQIARTNFMETLKNFVGRDDGNVTFEALIQKDVLAVLCCPLVQDPVGGIQCTALTSLAKLVDTDPLVGETIMGSGVLGAIVLGLSHNSPQVQVAANTAVQSLARISVANATHLIDAGALTAVLKQLDVGSDAAKEASLWTLKTFAAADYGIAEGIAQPDTLRLMVSLMKAHGAVPGVQKAALGALKHIAVHDWKLARAVVAAGPLPTAVAFTKDERHVPCDVRAAAFRFLSQVARHDDELAGQVADAGAVEPCICAASDTLQILRSASIVLLVELAKKNPLLANRLIEAGAAVCLVRYLQLEANKDSCQQGVLIAGFLAQFSPILAKVLIDAGVHREVISVLSFRDPTICSYAAWAVEQMGQFSEVTAMPLIAAGAMNDLLAAYGKHAKTHETARKKIKVAVKALLKHCTEVAPLLPFVATNQPLEMQLKLLLRLSVLMAPNPQARQLFVTSGALLRLQEILKLPEITKTEMGIRVGAAGGQINTLFPVPVVEYYSSEVGKA